MGFIDESCATLLSPLRAPRPSQEEKEMARDFDLLDAMEQGLSREIVQDFKEPLPDARALWRFHIERSEGQRQYRLYCDGGAFLMYARLAKDMHRVDIFMYDPREKDSALFDPQRPAFTMECNADRSEWRLHEERCDVCRHAPPGYVCSCKGRQELMRARHSNMSVGEGVNHCMDVAVQPQAVDGAWQEHRFVSKMPVWNAQVDSLVLDFKGRNVIPSAKNFQLAVEGDERGRVVCQYGKVAQDTFGLDFRFPLTVVQSFGLALSTIFWA